MHDPVNGVPRTLLLRGSVNWLVRPWDGDLLWLLDERGKELWNKWEDYPAA